MTLHPDAAYQALTARDARFDGQLYVGVTSTGIYCRPICRVRTPLPQNCRFFTSAAQAEAARFRPCLKCRPEIAPGAGHTWTVMDASRTLALQAAERLDALTASGDTPALAQLAAQLGISDRHLRRIFTAEHGVTPIQYLQTRRLLLAKQLLTDTPLPVAQVAFASGFASLRRFNAAFASRYRLSPGQLRRQADGQTEVQACGAAPVALNVTLAYRPPYDLPSLLRFLSLRAIPGIEQVEGLRIRRTLRPGSLAAEGGWLEACFLPDSQRVRLSYSPTLATASSAVLGAARRWLDLDANPQAIDTALAALPGAPGIRLPGSLDAFETAVRAILGQQVSVAAARTLAQRLTAHFGSPADSPYPGLTQHFPAPECIAAVELSQIAALGVVRVRAGAILALARAWPQLSALLRSPSAVAQLVQALVALPGIGHWTAEYIAMRTLGWPDAFPPRDVAVLKAMQRQFAITTPTEALAQAQAWRPWRSYAVLRLWNSLETAP